jgi:hypothetical protein
MSGNSSRYVDCLVGRSGNSNDDKPVQHKAIRDIADLSGTLGPESAGFRTSSEVAVDVHAFVQNTPDVDDALGTDPKEQNV